MARTKKTVAKKAAQKAEKQTVKKTRRGNAASLKPNASRPPIVDGTFDSLLSTSVNNVQAATWEAFLIRLAETGHVADSCKAVGLNRITAYGRKRDDKDFAERWEIAHQIGMSTLEDEAKRRAYHGVSKGVYYKGDRVDTEIVYSDQLLMFLMQGRDTRYKRKQEITGADAGPLLLLAKLDDEGLDDLIEQKLRDLKETPDA